MTELYYENYDGEMFFDIDSLEFSNNEYTFDIKSNYNGNEIGMHISIPVIVSSNRSNLREYNIPVSPAPTNSEFVITGVSNFNMFSC